MKQMKAEQLVSANKATTRWHM